MTSRFYILTPRLGERHIKSKETVPFSADCTPTIAVKVEYKQLFLITCFLSVVTINFPIDLWRICCQSLSKQSWSELSGSDNQELTAFVKPLPSPLRVTYPLLPVLRQSVVPNPHRGCAVNSKPWSKEQKVGQTDRQHEGKIKPTTTGTHAT